MALGASLEIQIAPKFSGEPIQPDSLRYQTSAGETFSITRVSYLLSGFALQRADGSWLELTNEVAWLDLEKNRSSHSIASVPSGDYRALRFHLGPDAPQNHADIAQFPADHPLNPNLNGLHWSWQGGFIFLALEGMWRNGGGAMDGWAYHLARDTNRTRITLAAPLDLTRDTKLELDFDIATLLNAPRPLSFGKDGSSTHSRDGDPIAAALVANLPGAFVVHRTTTGGASVPASLVDQLPPTPGSQGRSPHQPLYLPDKFTPFPFQMSATFPVPDLPHDNPLIAERVALGEKLFHETALSKDNTLSCASCHDVKHAFTDPRRYSVGVREQVGTRNAMPLFNLAWKSSFFWDGRAASLRAQALMPIQDHTEMDESLTNVVAKLTARPANHTRLPLTPALSLGERENHPPSPAKSETDDSAAIKRKPANGQLRSPLPGGEGQGEGEQGERQSADAEYGVLFTAAFGSPEVTPEKIGLAIESFVLTLTSSDSKFDRALAGKAQLTDDERRGLELFMTEYDPRREQFGADCFHCHGGPLFQSQTFANNGLELDPPKLCRICDKVWCGHRDLGRAKLTGKDSDRGKFATPSLRNVGLTAPYMHDGRFATLEEVVEHYSTGQKRSATLDPNLAKHPDGGVRLNDGDKRALVAFLKTLTEEKYRTDSEP